MKLVNRQRYILKGLNKETLTSEIGLGEVRRRRKRKASDQAVSSYLGNSVGIFLLTANQQTSALHDSVKDGLSVFKGFCLFRSD